MDIPKRRTKPRIEIDLVKVEGYAANGMSQEQIADALGISEKTLRNRKKECSDFNDAIKRGKAQGIAVVSNTLFEMARNKNIAAVIFFLKTRAGWKENEALEVNLGLTKKNGGKLPDDIRQILDELKSQRQQIAKQD